MLRFSHPAMMAMRRPAALNTLAAKRAAVAASGLLASQQTAAFSTRWGSPNSIGSSSSAVCTSSTNATLKEQRMNFISGSRSWLARTRGNAYNEASNWANLANNSPAQNNSPAYQSNTTGSTGEVLTPAVREHLMKVYNLLAVAIGCASAGSAAMLLTPLGKAIPWFVPCFGGLVPLLWLWFKPPANPVARQGLVLAFATLQGMGIAPIVKATAAAGVLGSALVMTGAVFAGFSAAAFLAPRASLVAFQGPLMGLFFGMFAISILNMFWPTAFAHSIVLYGGLALFSAFIAVDTQVMIERARCGEADVAFDALNMFTNVLQIFIRIAQILRGMSE